MTIRREKLSPLIHLEPNLLHTYIPMWPEPDCLANIEVWIKRANGESLPFSCDQDTPCCGKPRKKDCWGSTKSCGCSCKDNRWLLRYPAYDYQDGSVGFRWDNNIHQLPPGRYVAEIRDCGKVCHLFGIVSPGCRQIGGLAENQLWTGECGDADGDREGVEPVFGPWYNYKTTLTQALEPNDVLLRVKRAPNKEAWTAPFPELVVSDGVNESEAKVLFVNGTTIGVGREDSHKFLAGACVRFMWTPNNLADAGYDNPNFIGYEDLYDCGSSGDD